MIRLFDNAVWQRRLTTPFDNAIWQRRLTTSFDNIVWQRRLTTSFDKVVWQSCLTKLFYNTIWQRLSTTLFDNAVNQRRSTHLFDPSRGPILFLDFLKQFSYIRINCKGITDQNRWKHFCFQDSFSLSLSSLPHHFY